MIYRRGGVMIRWYSSRKQKERNKDVWNLRRNQWLDQYLSKKKKKQNQHIEVVVWDVGVGGLFCTDNHISSFLFIFIGRGYAPLYMGIHLLVPHINHR